MKNVLNLRMFSLLALAGLLTAACHSSSSQTQPQAAGTTQAGAAAKPFGMDCSMVPTSGSGSFSGMMHDPVATAASHNPLLSTLVHDVNAAGLANTLDTSQGITVFAPSNDAFAAAAKKHPKRMQEMMMHPSDPSGPLVKTLTYHVVQGQLSPAELAGTHTTLEGGTLTVTGSGEHFTVNGSANVICGDIHTSNATVYIIDQVLHA